MIMNTTIVTIFCFLALVCSGCASSPKTNSLAADMDAQYRLLVEKDKIIEVINPHTAILTVPRIVLLLSCRT